MQDPNFLNLFAHYIPEMLIVTAVLIHIVIETHAGIFNTSAYMTESFRDGFERYLSFKAPDYYKELKRVNDSAKVKTLLENAREQMPEMEY